MRSILEWLKQKLSTLVLKRSIKPSPFIRAAYCTPRQVVLLTARHKGMENVWPIDWHTPVSLNPEYYVISLNPGFGEELVRDSGYFIVNFVPASWENIIFYCGKTSGRNVDKFKETNLLKSEGKTVPAPYLAKALGVIECAVVQDINVGDHILFIGKVLHAIHQEEQVRLFHLDASLSESVDAIE